MSDDNLSHFSDDDPELGGDSRDTFNDQDSDFNYGDETEPGVYGGNREPATAAVLSNSTIIKNDYIDEAVELSDGTEDDVDSPRDDGEGESEAEGSGDGDHTDTREQMQQSAKRPSMTDSLQPRTSLSASTLIKNNYVDEAVELSDGDEDVPSPSHSPEQAPVRQPEERPAPVQQQQQQAMSQSMQMQMSQKASVGRLPVQQTTSHSEDEFSDKASDETDSDDDLEHADARAHGGPLAPGGYNAADYVHLQVSKEIHELFHYIVAFKPHELELPTMLRPFIPDYLPAIGDTDAFIKVPSPEDSKKKDILGLTVLDEPSQEQSDPSVVEARMLQHYKGKKKASQPTVRSIADASKNPNEISKWIQNIEDLHTAKPAAAVHYAKLMPDTETLMQLWPQEMEDIISQIAMPDEKLNMSVNEFARLACAILDIPVYGNIVESIHLMFTLYSDFKQNEHFNQEATQLNLNDSMMVKGLSTKMDDPYMQDETILAIDGDGGGHIDDDL
eukprot:TRINITY_DN18739_c0_g1::TRINITY_DN18739_c0_g1_i1::g.15216::m.15216 TRINITY_DN18739_c0_g1::TRINITY_DN18739_c0_g1_i1::g.15216  ORF type:complete len:502 (+),score=104.40,sp/Q9NQC8/IFT46_HUMAN/48.02/2e-69,IFT46_B_C/PF12317.3/3.5e+03,IFT46_B_C/PF12317.3/4.2e-82,DUF3220/PF11516.3/2.7e+03,DUF3220/PF11516.3/4e+02,DUF3220/PF11516.3/0.27 TRINITY_DN18739_c0_g1_i1:78-1583(+)